MQVNPANVKIEESWKHALWHEFEQDYFAHIKKVLRQAELEKRTIYPPLRDIFRAFNLTPFSKVKVVILGQDPYPNEGQATGLSFSVSRSVVVPPSLKNIFQELARTIDDFQMPTHGDLTAWAEQGVLMLNATLTVEAKQPNSHSKIGWQRFTDAVIRKISDEKTGVIFMLWGNFAKAKAHLIDAEKHHVLKAVHPSPLAGGGFFGCNHFLQTNRILIQQGQSPINWQI